MVKTMTKSAIFPRKNEGKNFGTNLGMLFKSKEVTNLNFFLNCVKKKTMEILCDKIPTRLFQSLS